MGAPAAHAGPVSWVMGESRKTVTVSFETLPGGVHVVDVSVTVELDPVSSAVWMSGENVVLDSSDPSMTFAPKEGFTGPNGVFRAVITGVYRPNVTVTATACNMPPGTVDAVKNSCSYGETGSAVTP